jgi:hypothetical protein
MEKGKKGTVFLGHMENVSWQAFEKYSEILRDMIRGKSGIYALYHNKNVYYVGLATNLMGRIKAHLKDRHNGKWDRFSVYLTKRGSNLKELESLVLRIIRKSGNAVSGKLARSRNLHPELNRRAKEFDTSKRVGILGGPVAERHMRNKARRFKGYMALESSTNRRLIAFYKGKKFTATLKRDGTIRYDGKTYESPSAAGRAVINGACNGWHLWKYKNDRGQWTKLNELKH